MSLVGKPLVYKNYRTDERFRRVQSKMHNFLERPRGWKAAGYHFAVLVFLFISQIYYVSTAKRIYQLRFLLMNLRKANVVNLYLKLPSFVIIC